MVILDTSGIIALLRENDPGHLRVCDAMQQLRRPYIVPAMVMAEACFMIEELTNTEVLAAFLSDIEQGDFALVYDNDKLPRIRELVIRYADLPLGFSDAAVIACAQSRGGQILTLDRRDFEVVARGEGGLELYP